MAPGRGHMLHLRFAVAIPSEGQLFHCKGLQDSWAPWASELHGSQPSQPKYWTQTVVGFGGSKLGPPKQLG